jgi:aquaporin Z
MIAAMLATALIDYPSSPLHFNQPLAQRLLIGLAMGATAVAIIYSPWGRQSGAHFNPAVTIAFYRLGKVMP